MATNIFYKEIVDPDDETKKIPVRIDDLFQPKSNLGEDHNVPKEKEVGIIDSGRDLSNLFELADEAGGIPSAMSIGGEPTYIYTDFPKSGSTDAIPDDIVVRSVSGNINSGKRVASWGANGEYDQGATYINANKTWTVPAEYRDKYKYWLFTNWQEGTRGNRTHCAVRAGILTPGTTTLHTGSPRTDSLRNSYQQARLYLFDCEVEQKTVLARADGKVDLSEVYMGKGMLDNWWLPILYFKNIPNQTAPSYSSVTISNLTKLPFKGALQQSEWDDEWGTPGYYHHGKDFHFSKGFGTTKLSFSRANSSRRYSYIFGIPMSTGI